MPTAPPETKPASRRHVVKAGETLFALAERYYGDKQRFVAIYQANRALLKSPDELAPGTDLVIPDLAEPDVLNGENKNP